MEYIKDYIKDGRRNPERIRPMLEKLEEAWVLYPDMRLGQLLGVCAGTDHIMGIEDDVMYERIQGYTDYMKGIRQ